MKFILMCSCGECDYEYLEEVAIFKCKSCGKNVAEHQAGHQLIGDFTK